MKSEPLSLKEIITYKYGIKNQISKVLTNCNNGTFPQNHEIDDRFAFRVQRYLRDQVKEKRLSNNTVVQYTSQIKSMLRQVENLPSKNFETILCLGKQKTLTTFTWVNEDELKRLQRVETRDKKEKYVKITFLLGAYTGARLSDYTRFDINNISNGMLHYITQKTGTHVSLPVKPIVRKLLKQLPKTEPVSKAYYGYKIKNLGMRARIHKKVKLLQGGKEKVGCKYNYLTSHTARRSFATNLYLRGAGLLEISRLLGHKDVEVTQQYIVCGYKDYSKELMAFFRY